MRIPSRDEMSALLSAARVSRRLVRDLRYNPESISRPDDRDFVVAQTKSGNAGVLLYGLSIYAFELTPRRPNVSGRVEPIICDICRTWRRGTASSVISFRTSDRSSVSYLVCGDLDCSLHVRDLTEASKLSRAQLREHMTPQARIDRLNQRLQTILP